MYYPGIFLAYVLFYSAMQYLGWVGQFVESLMTKIRNAEVGDIEVKKTNFQQYPQGLLESQKKHHLVPQQVKIIFASISIRCLLLPDIPTSMFYFDLLFLGETIIDIARGLVSDTGVISLVRILQVGQ